MSLTRAHLLVGGLPIYFPYGRVLEQMAETVVVPDAVRLDFEAQLYGFLTDDRVFSVPEIVITCTPDGLRFLLTETINNPK